MVRISAALTIMLLLTGLPGNSEGKKALTFQTVSMGEIVDKAATDAGFRTRYWSEAHFGFTTFKASSGNTLAVFYDDFRKPEEAKRFFDWRMDKSFKVLSRSTKTSAHGERTEYRAEFVPNWSHSDTEVMWVIGTSVHWIDAHIVDDALALERQYRR